MSRCAHGRGQSILAWGFRLRRQSGGVHSPPHREDTRLDKRHGSRFRSPMLRRRLPNHILVVVAAAALVACSDSTALPGDDASIGNPDGAPDGAGEAAPDATPDTTHDGPDGTDASPDVDARPDTGPDGSPPDADLDARDDADAPPPSCILEESSTLPGVRFAFRTSTCTFTLAQAMSGISIPYDLVVEHDVLGFVPGQPYWYGSDAANLDINEVLSGG